MKPFSSILFVARPGANDSAALREAVTLANNNQAQLTVIGMIDEERVKSVTRRFKPKELLEGMIEQRRTELASLISREFPTESTIEVKVLVGSVFLEAIREVLRHQHDLVIKSAESIEGISHIFGSTDLNLLRNCPCPVWIIKPTLQQGYRKIVAAVDYAPDDKKVNNLNDQILDLAGSVALTEFAELHITHAWQLPYESFLRSPRSFIPNIEVDSMAEEEHKTRRHWLKKLVTKSFASYGKEATDYIKPKTHLPKGEASKLIPAFARDIGADLVVMGSVSRTGIPGFVIGNTAETVLNQIDCSVLVVKPPGFTSPVTVP